MKNTIQISLSILTTVYIAVLVRNIIKFYTEFDMFPDSVLTTALVLSFFIILIKAADALLINPINKEHPNGN